MHKDSPLFPRELLKEYGVEKIKPLVEYIIKNRDYKTKDSENIRIFLSQILNGHRRMPDVIQEIIVEYCTVGKPEEEKRQFRKELRESLKFMYRLNQSIKGSNDLGKVELLNDHAKLAVWIKDAKKISTYISSLSNFFATGLWKSLQLDVNSFVRYIFYVERGDEVYSNAVSFWGSFYFHYQSLVDWEKLRDVDTPVRLFIVPESEIDFTVIVLDEGTKSEKGFICLFEMLTDSKSRCTVYNLDYINLEKFLRRYKRLKNASSGFEEFAFTKADLGFAI